MLNAIEWCFWGEGIMTNITESKLAEQEIRESRRRLSELTSHLERAGGIFN